MQGPREVSPACHHPPPGALCSCGSDRRGPLFMWAGEPHLGSPEREATPLPCAAAWPRWGTKHGRLRACRGRLHLENVGRSLPTRERFLIGRLLQTPRALAVAPWPKLAQPLNIKGSQCCEEGLEMTPSWFPHRDQERIPRLPQVCAHQSLRPCSHRGEEGMRPTTQHSPQAGQPPPAEPGPRGQLPGSGPALQPVQGRP